MEERDAESIHQIWILSKEYIRKWANSKVELWYKRNNRSNKMEYIRVGLAGEY